MGLTVNALVCKLEGEQLISTNIDKNKLVYVFMPAVAVATFVMVYIVPKFFS